MPGAKDETNKITATVATAHQKLRPMNLSFEGCGHLNASRGDGGADATNRDKRAHVGATCRRPR